MNDGFDRIFYFAAKSSADLKEGCAAVQVKYHLPDFEFDCESPEDEYGYSRNLKIGFNITKTNDYDEIAKWSKSGLGDVNFQIILMFYNDSAEGYDVKEIQAFLTKAVKAQALKYHEW